MTPSNNGLDPAELPKIAARIGFDSKSVTAFNDCLASGKYKTRVDTDIAEAVQAGGNGTPFSVFVVKKAMNEQSIQTIQKINDETKSPQYPDGLIAIATDKARVSMSGALPFSYVQRIIDALLGK